MKMENENYQDFITEFLSNFSDHILEEEIILLKCDRDALVYPPLNVGIYCIYLE